MDSFYTAQKLAHLFASPNEDYTQFKSRIEKLEAIREIPESERRRSGALWRKVWTKEQLQSIAQVVGFLPKPAKPKSLTVFTTKGGVLKTTLTLNIARLAAIHGLKVCVVGLDIQGDVTNALGFQRELEDDKQDLNEVLEKIKGTQGLHDFFYSKVRLEDLIQPTDLENLYLIPETAELVQLNDALSNVHRREFWLKEKVVDRLKGVFDLVIMDCSPNWSKLTTNALVASDLLVSPLECKINNFRNFQVFQQFLSEFTQEMHMNLAVEFIPTRYAKNRKLSMDILEWYRKNVPGCSPFGIRECVLGEEAVALNLSFGEHDPSHAASQEMKGVLLGIFNHLLKLETQSVEIPSTSDSQETLQWR
jgi:chromosome partitioning protein